MARPAKQNDRREKKNRDSIDEIPKLMRERFFRKMIQHVNIYRFVYSIGNLYTNGLIDTIEIKLLCEAKRNSRLLFNIKDTSQQHISSENPIEWAISFLSVLFSGLSFLHWQLEIRIMGRNHREIIICQMCFCPSANPPRYGALISVSLLCHYHYQPFERVCFFFFSHAVTLQSDWTSMAQHRLNMAINRIFVICVAHLNDLAERINERLCSLIDKYTRSLYNYYHSI